MNRFGSSMREATAGIVLGAWIMAAAAGGAAGKEITLKDGRVLKGKLAPISGLSETPQPAAPDGEGPLQLIVMVDDDLRRTFVSTRQVQQVGQEGPATAMEKFVLRQRVLHNGPTIKHVGPILRITPFDEHGRRIFSMNTTRGKIDVIQAITELTPEWAKVEGISHVWDMRIATSSVPTDVLHRILIKQIDPKNIEHCKKIASFYLQCQRYAEAQQALQAILQEFPQRADLKEDLMPLIRALRQLGSQRLLAELKLRSEAGQHTFALGKLKAFPSQEVAGEILQAVREMIQQYETLQTQRDSVVQQFDSLLAKVEDKPTQDQVQPIRDEISHELGPNTLDRMAAFRQALNDPQLLPVEKLALAISGWLTGSDAATVKMPVALSLYRVRDLVKKYLNEPIKMNRNQLFSELRKEEGAALGMVAALLAHMKPPIDTPEGSRRFPGQHELETAGLPQEAPFRYLVQLPPEYDPYRRYPAIVTLHGAGTTAAHQIDWWAGAWNDAGQRTGQATRHGYIVVAPEWSAEHQKQYGYSAREHAAVLYCLRDACRRFSIDTDRVFLSGHSMGGDAAWDLGLAHPDLWAGVMPIVAEADRYCAQYWENAKRVPFYVVGGEMDGNKLARNARDLDRYLKRGYNATVVEYLGRGHENFSDEIQRLFDWMGRFRREFFPREFECVTMRQFDNYFWWVELEGLPPRSLVDPANWPPPRGTLPVQLKASLTANNGLFVRTGTTRVTVWLSPEMVDFKRRVNVVVNGRALGNSESVLPNLETLLEDVRTRGDRRHPFWAKVDMPTGRVVAE